MHPFRRAALALTPLAIVAACTLTLPATRIAGTFQIGDGGVQTFTATVTEVTEVTMVALDASVPDAEPAESPDAAAPGSPDAATSGSPDAAIPSPPDAGPVVPPPTCARPDLSGYEVLHYCPTGDDSAPGTAALPRRTLDRLAQDMSAPATRAFLLCRGGVWGSGMRLWPDATTGNLYYLGDYGDSAQPKPLIQGTLDISAGDDSALVGNLTIQNVDLDGQDVAWSTGLFLYRQVTNMHACGMEISRFHVCVQYAQYGGASRNLSFTDSNVHNCASLGFIGGGEDMLLARNTFDNCGSSFNGLQGHNVYVASALRMVVADNVLTRNGNINGNGCETVPLTAHGGYMEGLVIERNLIREAPGTAQPGCWGIAVDAASTGASGCRDCIIRDNILQDLGNTYIAVQDTPNMHIERNVIQHSAAMPFGTTAITVPSRPSAPGGLGLSGVAVKDNLVTVTNGSQCLALDSGAVVEESGNACTIAP